MRVLIASDSHGNIDILEKIYKKHQDVDIYLHAGDSEAVSPMQLEPYRAVRGNCDFLADFPEHLIIPTPLGKIWIQHHPETKIENLKKNEVKSFIHGHTHRRRNEEKEGIVFINPGSVTFPHDSLDGTYAILEINKNDYRVTCYEV